jgi:hypothetical protein
VQPNQERARDPKVIALTLLCRSICNFRAATLLIQQEHVVKAAALVRLLSENLLWLGALRESGSEFVKDMISDDRHKQKILGQLVMDLTTKHGGDVNSPDAMTLRNIMKRLGKNSSHRRLRADEIAASGVVELVYVYAR